MKLNFIKVNPTQNMTILVKDKIPKDLHKQVANELLKYENLYGEQVGFIEPPVNEKAWARLQMMGGEFCGNATMALACVLAAEKNISINDSISIPIEVSGTKDLLNCEVEVKENYFIGKVEMPLPSLIKELSLQIENRIYKLTLITLPGISHFIVNDSEIETSNNIFIEAIINYSKNTINSKAIGIIFFNEKESYIKPLVYVKSNNSKIWERGCGSGTAAIGCYLARLKQQDINIDITQQGGEIKAIVKYDKEIQNVWIQGKVKIIAEGIVYV